MNKVGRLALAVVTGIPAALFTMWVLGSVYAWLFVAPAGIDNAVSVLITTAAFGVSGYVAAAIAKGNEMPACVLLGLLFFALTVTSYYWPGGSDTRNTLIATGSTKLAACVLGGWFRLLHRKRRWHKTHA